MRELVLLLCVKTVSEKMSAHASASPIHLQQWQNRQQQQQQQQQQQHLSDAQLPVMPPVSPLNTFDTPTVASS